MKRGDVLDFYLEASIDLGGAEPYDVTIFHKNITHNLNVMAGEAGIYKALWRPEEINAIYAGDIIELLEKGLEKMRSNPEHYKQFNPDNGWGSYDGLVYFAGGILIECRKYPKATIHIRR